LKTVVGMPSAQVGTLLTIATLCLLPLTLLAGSVSDRIGRRPVLLTGLFIGALALLPVFYGLAHWADQPLIVVALLLVLVFALACITGPQTATLAELFPARTRYSAVALPHNLAAGWIGGLSPLVVTWLGVRLENPFAGLWYLVTLLTITFLIGWRYLPETRGVDLHA
jgi:MFS family permease